jgi:phosphatidate cytidylyltransferase
VSGQEQATNKWSDLGVRSLSALVMAPIVLTALYQGGAWAQWLFTFISVLMALEYVAIVHGGDKRQFALHAMAGISAALLTSSGWALFAIGIIVATTLISASMRRGQSAQVNMWWATAGVPYVALPVMALVLLRDDAQWGWNALLWLALVVWATDIGAYFSGRVFGGPKLAPRLSPKKTWAGLLGGIAAATAVSIALCMNFSLPAMVPSLIAAALAVISQAGDIYESALKRHFNLKDASNLIPGHGGVLDRVDGLIAAAVVAAVVGFLHNPSSVAKGLLLW